MPANVNLIEGHRWSAYSHPSPSWHPTGVRQIRIWDMNNRPVSTWRILAIWMISEFQGSDASHCTVVSKSILVLGKLEVRQLSGLRRMEFILISGHCTIFGFRTPKNWNNPLPIAWSRARHRVWWSIIIWILCRSLHSDAKSSWRLFFFLGG